MQLWELVSIAARLGSWTNVELWSMVWFLYRQGWTLTHIHRELLSVFVNVMTRKQVSMCCWAFKNGRVLRTNKLQKGMPRALTSSDSISCGKRCAWDMCVKIHQIVAQLNILPTEYMKLFMTLLDIGRWPYVVFQANCVNATNRLWVCA
jgi:hypothetical protein